MDLPELAKSEIGKIKAAAAKERAWFGSNLKEAVALACLCGGLGLIVGFAVGRFL